MTAVARMVMLDLRSITPYRNQALLILLILAAFATKNPVVALPVVTLLLTSQVAAYPFQVADKADLETLYAVLPVPRRAVLYGHYAWALATFVATAAFGIGLVVLYSRIHSTSLSARELMTLLTLSWAIFVVNTTIQFPLFIRFGYSRVSLLSTFAPLALVMIAVTRLHLTVVSVSSLQHWLPVIWVAGAAAVVASAATAVTVDRRRRGARGRKQQSRSELSTTNR
jgi:hypothetical protein